MIVSWLGHNDLKDWKAKATGNQPANLVPNPGPIERVAREYADKLLPTDSHLAEIHIISSWGHKGQKHEEVISLERQEQEVKGFCEWLQRSTTAVITYSLMQLENPTDYPTTYKATTNAVTSLLVPYRDNVPRLTFHVSSGTPTMQSIWLLLAKTEYPGAELIKTSWEAGLERVDFPFDIAVKYQPYFALAADQKTVKMQGLDSEALAAIKWRSPQMQEVLRLTANVARHDKMHVLIEGESGVGKELFAKLIHKSSHRRNGPFVTVNCGALPGSLIESELFGYKKGAFTGADRDREGKFQQADGGILFLDEIGDLPLEQQVKMLRLTDTHSQVIAPVGARGESDEITVNVRIIAATNRNLMARVAEHAFRQDLFFRLAVGHLQVPSLRERKSDLDLLIDHFVKKLNAQAEENHIEEKHLAAEARNLLCARSWPGNVRELEHTLTKALWLYSEGSVVSEYDIRRALLPVAESSRPGPEILNRPLGEKLDLEALLVEVKGHYVLRAMREAGSSNLAAIARLLNIKEVTFRNQLYRDTSSLKKFLQEHPDGYKLLKKEND